MLMATPSPDRPGPRAGPISVVVGSTPSGFGWRSTPATSSSTGTLFEISLGSSPHIPEIDHRHFAAGGRFAWGLRVPHGPGYFVAELSVPGRTLTTGEAIAVGLSAPQPGSRTSLGTDPTARWIAVNDAALVSEAKARRLLAPSTPSLRQYRRSPTSILNSRQSSLRSPMPWKQSDSSRSSATASIAECDGLRCSLRLKSDDADALLRTLRSQE